MSGWGRRRSDNRPYPKRPRRSLFDHRPRSQEYSREIRSGDRLQAEASVEFADRRWTELSERSARVHLLQAMNQEANRAKVASENRHISPHEREEASEAHAVLRRWVVEHKGKE